MIINDDELLDAQANAVRIGWRKCDREECSICDPYPDFSKEDLVEDLIQARAQIKVLESNQCAC
jgi:hypothetical protein